MVKNLLIVDDNPSMRRLIASVVADLTVSIHECDDGAKAMAAYEAYLPEWILMDVEMKEMDGLTATQAITTAHPEAKVLIVTKYGTPRLRDKAHAAGASGYVLKEDLLAIRAFIH